MLSKEALEYLDKTCGCFATEKEFALVEKIKEDLEVLELLKTKQVDIGHLVSLCRCCGYESGLNCYNEILINKAITLKELEMIMEWLEDE